MIKKINVSKEFGTLETLVERLQSPEQSSWNIDKVSPWHNAFRDYVNKFKYTEETFETLISNETYFRSKLTQFLYSPRGMIFQVRVQSKKCNDPVTCTDIALFSALFLVV